MTDSGKTSGAIKPAVPDLATLVRRAETGDESALPMLRKLLQNMPVLADSLGNMARQVESTLIGNAAGRNLAFKEALTHLMEQKRKEAAGESPSPLETLLAERIALCWLSLHDAEIRFSQSKDLSIKQAEFWQKRIDGAHRRYLSAIKAMATIRKLSAPVLQVNIARKQVNVLNTAPPADQPAVDLNA